MPDTRKPEDNGEMVNNRQELCMSTPSSPRAGLGQRRPSPGPGFIRGLLSSASQIVSFIGLPAMTIGHHATHQIKGSLQERAFLVWVRHTRHRSNKRRVTRHLDVWRSEIVMRQHLAMWFHCCERMSGSTPPPRSRSPPFRVLSSPALSTNSDGCGTASKTRTTCAIRVTKESDFLISPQTSPLQKHRQTTQEARSPTRPSVPHLDVQNAARSSPSPRKLKDMRPGAFFGSAPGQQAPITQKSRSMPPSPAGSVCSDRQLGTIAYEPCPSPKRASRNILQENIKKMQMERPLLLQNMCTSENYFCNPASSLLTHPATASNAVVAVVDPEDEQNNCEPEIQTGNDAKADLFQEILQQMSKVEQMNRHNENQACVAQHHDSSFEGDNLIDDVSPIVSPRALPYRSAEPIPQLSRSTSEERSWNSEHSTSKSPLPRLNDLVIVDCNGAEESERQHNFMDEQTASDKQIRHLEFGAPAWQRVDSSWRKLDTHDSCQSSTRLKDAIDVVEDGAFCGAQEQKLSGLITNLAAQRLTKDFRHGSCAPPEQPEKSRLNSAFRALSRGASLSSICTYDGECIDSCVFEHDYKLSVRAMQAFKQRLFKKRLLVAFKADVQAHAALRCIRYWGLFVEKQQNLKRVVSERRRNSKRIHLQEWFLMASAQQALRLKLERVEFEKRQKTKHESLHEWSTLAAAQQELRRRLERVDFARRRKMKKVFLAGWSMSVLEQEADTFRRIKVVNQLLSLWSQTVEQQIQSKRILRQIVTSWREFQSESKLAEQEAIFLFIRSFCRLFFWAWAELIAENKIESVYSSILCELQHEVVESAILEEPMVIHLRENIHRHLKIVTIQSWLKYMSKRSALERSFCVQSEKTDHFCICRIFCLWVDVARESRKGKTKWMNPPTNINGMSVPSPLELLRRTRGDVEFAKSIQQELQTKMIQTMLALSGNQISEDMARDLLLHAKGNTRRALHAALEAEKFGIAVKHRSHVQRLLFFVEWFRVVDFLKNMLLVSVAIRQRVDLRMISEHFAVWSAFLRKKEYLWQSRITIQERFFNFNLRSHFEAWSCHIPVIHHLREFAERLGHFNIKVMRTRAMSMWQYATVQSALASTSFQDEKIRHSRQLQSCSITTWSRWAFTSKRSRLLRAISCRRECQRLSAQIWGAWFVHTQIKKLKRLSVTEIRERWLVSEQNRLLHGVWHAWSEVAKERKKERVLAILNYYEGEIRPLVQPLLPSRQIAQRSFGNRDGPKRHQILPKVNGILVEMSPPRDHVLCKRVHHISSVFNEYIGVDAATRLLAETHGNVKHATHRAYRGVRKAIAVAHYVGNKLSAAFEAWKDFVYMWKAWQAMMGRAILLPAKHCFARWSRWYRRCYKVFKFNPFWRRASRLKSFILAWWSVTNYSLCLGMNATYLCNKRKVLVLHTLKMACQYKLWYASLFRLLLRDFTRWTLQDAWQTWQKRWALRISGRYVRQQYLRRIVREMLRTWSDISFELRNAQLILSRENTKIWDMRLKVWQREFFTAYRARKTFLTSATLVAIMRVRRTCERVVRIWQIRSGCAREQKCARGVCHVVRSRCHDIVDELFCQRLLIGSFTPWKELANMSHLEKLCSTASEQVTRFVALKQDAACMRGSFGRWHNMFSARYELIASLPSREHRTMNWSFGVWADSQFRPTNFVQQIHEMESCRVCLQTWYACMQNSNQMREAQAHFARKSQLCVQLTVLTEWYRWSAAIRGLQTLQNRNMLRRCLSAIRETYRARFEAKRKARQIGQTSFRNWQDIKRGREKQSSAHNCSSTLSSEGCPLERLLSLDSHLSMTYSSSGVEVMSAATSPEESQDENPLAVCPLACEEPDASDMTQSHEITTEDGAPGEISKPSFGANTGINGLHSARHFDVLLSDVEEFLNLLQEFQLAGWSTSRSVTDLLRDLKSKNSVAALLESKILQALADKDTLADATNTLTTLGNVSITPGVESDVTDNGWDRQGKITPRTREFCLGLYSQQQVRSLVQEARQLFVELKVSNPRDLQSVLRAMSERCVLAGVLASSVAKLGVLQDGLRLKPDDPASDATMGRERKLDTHESRHLCSESAVCSEVAAAATAARTEQGMVIDDAQGVVVTVDWIDSARGAAAEAAAMLLSQNHQA